MLHINHLLSTDLIERLAKKIETEAGLSFSGSKRRDLRLAIGRMAESMGMESDAECMDWLLSGVWDKPKADLCARYLTIGETYFFREPRAFDLVHNYAKEKVRAIGSEKTRLRIWSAGCCTGEEAYSIAMTLRQAAPQLTPGQISILGTDINSRHLQFAQTAAYRQWSFRSPEAILHKSNFSMTSDNQFQLNDEIRKLVKFSELNLASPAYPSIATDTHAMDIIFCRNVLMYFSKEQALNVIQRLRRCLVDGGWLIVSPSEASADLFPGFSGTYYPDAIFFQKSDREDVLMTVEQPDGEPECQQLKRLPGSGGTADAAPFGRTRQTLSASGKLGKSKGSRLVPAQGNAQAMDEGPSTAGHYHAKALIAMESEDYLEAMKNLKSVLYLQPDSIIGHYLMGVVQSAQSRQRTAEKLFEITDGLLASFRDDYIVPESDGLTAAYLRASVRAVLRKVTS